MAKEVQNPKTTDSKNIKHGKLIGHYYSILTDKSRTAFPKKFRDRIGNRGICAKWYESCLVVVAENAWEALVERLTGSLQVFTGPVRDTDRFILGSAFEIDFDSQGRFVIPKILREYAKLGQDIVFVGLGDRVEIWNKEDWMRKEKEVQEKASQMVEELAKEIRKEVGNS